MDPSTMQNPNKMTPQQEAIFEKKAEQHFKGHRGLQNGRDYRWNIFRWITEEDRQNYRENFDKVFPDAPGAGY